MPPTLPFTLLAFYLELSFQIPILETIKLIRIPFQEAKSIFIHNQDHVSEMYSHFQSWMMKKRIT